MNPYIIIEKVPAASKLEEEEFKTFQPLRFYNLATSEVIEFWNKLSFSSMVNRAEKGMKWDRKAIQAAIHTFKTEEAKA